MEYRSREGKRGMSGPDPRLSKAVTAHSSIVAALNVIHSLRTQGLRRTLLFAAVGNGIPILGELLAIHVLKVLRHHVRPQVKGVPLAIALDHLAAIRVDEAKVGVSVSYVQSGRRLWFVPANIHGGPILLP
jgi:hypothetical protein